MRPRAIAARGGAAAERAALLHRHGQAGRVRRDRVVPARAPGRVPRAPTWSGSSCAKYPHHEIGAHLFGTVGELNPEQEKDPRYRDVDLGDRVGQTGVELAVRPLPARAQRRQPAAGRRDREPQPPARRSASRSRAASCACRWTWTCRRPARRRWPGVPAAAPSPSWTSKRRGARPRLRAVVRPEHLLQGHQAGGDYDRLQDPDNGVAAHQPRDPGRLSHRAPPSSW